MPKGGYRKGSGAKPIGDRPKSKINITLDADLLNQINELCHQGSRSQFIETLIKKAMTYTKSNITPDEYETKVIIFDVSRNSPMMGTKRSIPTYSVGLSEKVGEVLGLLERHFKGDSNPDFKKQLTAELGDVIANAVLVGYSFGISFEDILQKNVEKLEAIKNGTHMGTGSDR